MQFSIPLVLFATVLNCAFHAGSVSAKPHSPAYSQGKYPAYGHEWAKPYGNFSSLHVFHPIHLTKQIPELAESELSHLDKLGRTDPGAYQKLKEKMEKVWHQGDAQPVPGTIEFAMYKKVANRLEWSQWSQDSKTYRSAE
ncbi:hypothetical protein BC835DRAFT_1304531 [Cytidiella melzeri]|nr:hypothetical protein BC835DRAFT_1304531 [Cytidiella melzeri]